jgi:hypothetical protein
MMRKIEIAGAVLALDVFVFVIRHAPLCIVCLPTEVLRTIGDKCNSVFAYVGTAPAILLTFGFILESRTVDTCLGVMLVMWNIKQITSSRTMILLFSQPTPKTGLCYRYREVRHLAVHENENDHVSLLKPSPGILTLFRIILGIRTPKALYLTTKR